MKIVAQHWSFFLGGLSVLFLLNSCDYVDHLAGTPIAEAPFFRHHETFIEGQNLHAAVDFARFSGKKNSKYDIYVVEHKTTAEWDTNPALVDVTGTVETATLIDGDLSKNTTMIWHKMKLPTDEYPWHKQYDIVFDFNQDGFFDKKNDVVDKIGVLELLNGPESGGFTLIKDPSDKGTYGVRVEQYELGAFSIPIDSLPCECRELDDMNNPLKGIAVKGLLYFPQPKNATSKKYPLVILAHGKKNNRFSYAGFPYLGELLASRGYVVASIDLCHRVRNTCQIELGTRTYHRGLIVHEHIERLLFKPITDSYIQNTVRPTVDPHQIGLVGHSRGGEGIIAAEQVSIDKNPSHYTLKALVSLAPSDVTITDSGIEATNPANCTVFKPTLPYLMMYGTRDIDRRLGQGYRLLDKAQRHKFGVTLNGGFHNFFNERWGPDSNSGAISTGNLGNNEQNLLRQQQQNFTKSYVHAFFNIFLRSEQSYFPLFSGNTPPALTPIAGNTVLHSYQPIGWNNIRLSIDEFENPPLQENDLSGNNSVSPTTSSAYLEDWLGQVTGASIWNHIPHYSEGLVFEWTTPSNTLIFPMPVQDVKYYNYLSFRIAKRHVPLIAPLTLADYERYNVSVQLKDNSGNTSTAINASAYAPSKIFYTDLESSITHKKSILQTIMIPLRAFTANGSTVNLTELRAVIFQFESLEGKKKVIIDDVEFLGADPSKPDPGIL